MRRLHPGARSGHRRAEQDSSIRRVARWRITPSSIQTRARPRRASASVVQVWCALALVPDLVGSLRRPRRAGPRAAPRSTSSRVRVTISALAVVVQVEVEQQQDLVLVHVPGLLPSVCRPRPSRRRRERTEPGRSRKRALYQHAQTAPARDRGHAKIPEGPASRAVGDLLRKSVGLAGVPRYVRRLVKLAVIALGIRALWRSASGARRKPARAGGRRRPADELRRKRRVARRGPLPGVVRSRGDRRATLAGARAGRATVDRMTSSDEG
jgi:hypothetical protein